MKTWIFLFLVALTFNVSAQTPFMVCKAGGYSDEDLKNFLFEENEYGDLVLKQDAFVQNYAVQSTRVINEGYEHCGKDYRVTKEDLEWVIDNSYIENLEMKAFVNSKKVGDDIIFFEDSFTGGVRIHEYDGCRVAWMKDTCANLIEYQLPQLPPPTSGIVQNKKPKFVGKEDNAPVPGGGKSPDDSGDAEPLAEAEKVVVDSIKKPTQWGELEYLKQQQELAKQVLDSMGVFSQTGSGSTIVAINSFNTTNTYVMPASGGSSQENSDGQYVYHRGSWVPASYYSDLSGYGGPRIRLYAGLRVAYGVSSYPAYCPPGLPYDGYWDGSYYRSALDGRTLAQDNRGNWQYQGGPSPNVDYSVLNQNRWKPETTGYTSNSYHPSTHRPIQNVGGYYGPRRF